jgi:hypothetical protein
MRVSPLEKYGEVVADMLFEALRGEDLPGICKRAGQRVGVNVDRLLAQTRDDPMTACYVDSSFPAFLYYLAKVSHASVLECLVPQGCGMRACVGAHLHRR